MKRWTTYAILVSCLSGAFLAPAAVGQETLEDRYRGEGIIERPFEKQKWEELTEGLDYTEQKKDEKKRETVQTRDGREGVDSERRRRDPFSVNQGSGIMKFIIVLLAVVVLVLLLRGLLGSDLRVRNKKIKGKEISIEQIEEDIENADLQSFIQQALSEEQYALAVRLYYLAVLKELALRKAIRWKKEKTNLDYLREMRSSDHFKAFKSLTFIFERVWYGERPLDREGFLQIAPRFEAFIQQLNTEQLPA